MRFLFLVLVCFSISHSLVTITPVDLGSKPGFSGKVEASFDTKRGNTDKDEYKAGFRIQYDNNKTYLIWVDFTGSYGEASGVKNTNKTYAHLRYIHSWQKNIDWEIYLQSEANEFTMTEARRLAGGGLRFHLLDELFGKIYLGIGAFHEYINYSTNVDPLENNDRANIYLAYTKKFKNKTKISYVGYFQPKLDMMDDYILSNGLELKIDIYKELYLKFKIFYDIDTKPAIGVKKYDFSQTTSFLYQF
jgi:putative salt-induced outer membrane protein YdiY